MFGWLRRLKNTAVEKVDPVFTREEIERLLAATEEDEWEPDNG